MAPSLGNFPMNLSHSASLHPSTLTPHSYTNPIFPSELAFVNESAHLSGTDADHTALLGSGADRQTS